MATDRRQHPRLPRLLKLFFDWDGLPTVAVTTDISVGGAFLNTTIYPAPDTRLTLRYRADGGLDLRFHATVERAIDPLQRISVVPGIGVRWRSVQTDGSPDQLARVLAELFEAPVQVRQENGASVWRPQAALKSVRPRLDVFKQDIEALDEVRPKLPDRPAQGRERRQTDRYDARAKVTFFVNRRRLDGHVRDLSLRGLWVNCDGALPLAGDVVTCRYPVRKPSGLTWTKLVGVVVRTTEGASRGFAVEILRADDVDSPGAFEEHLSTLSETKEPL